MLSDCKHLTTKCYQDIRWTIRIKCTKLAEYQIAVAELFISGKILCCWFSFLIPLLVFCIGYGKYEWCDHFGWSPYCHGSHQYYCYKHYLWRVTWDVLGSGGGSFHDILRHHVGELPCDHCRLSIHFSSNSGQFICGWIGEPWFYFRDIGCVHDTANGFSKHHGS